MFLERKLIDAVGTKSENLHLMRFIAAIMVILFHSFHIAKGSETGEWFRVLTNHQLTMGEFAVSLFFLCGGYLIAMSVEKYKTAKEYFLARIKRLFPPLIFVTIATVIGCSFISDWKPAGYVLSWDTWKYLLNAVFIRVHELPGVFANNPDAVVNGSLWTLPLEFVCYILCFIAFKCTLLQKKRFPYGIPIVVIGAIVAWNLGEMYQSLREGISPVLLFYIGMGYWVYREYVVLSARYFLISIVVFVLLFVVGAGDISMLVAFPYMMMYLWFGMKQCSPKLGKLGNYSYGIYLWGFTVQQVVVYFWPKATMPPMLNALISIPISILLGVLTYEIVENKSRGIPDWVRNIKCPDAVYVAILIVYELRHVNLGLDLWDTGYNYANFQYMSLEHMDSMWFFATYLANAVGHMLTKLPFADTLLGMNVYTGLIAAALPVIAYFFCTRVLKMKRWVVFAGGMLTLALYWSPTAGLYNYLSYIFVLIAVILIYRGLVEDKKWNLFAAGVVLGINVLTRVSNLPQMILIIAVWGYGLLEYLENHEKEVVRLTGTRTLWCVGGYLAGLGVLLGFVHIRYGLGEYVAAIKRLFAMTDIVVSYKPLAMLNYVRLQYQNVLPWCIKLGKYILLGLAIWGCIEVSKKYIQNVQKNAFVQKCLDFVGIAACILIARKIVVDMYYGGFCEMNYLSYDAVLRPAILFMIVTMLIATINCFRKDISKGEKLIGILISIVLIVNSLGSGNGVYTSFNNLCLAAPYTLWYIYLFIRNAKSSFAWPVKTVAVAFLYVLFWQSALFGDYFFFTEAQGAEEVEVMIDNNAVLEGIKMHEYKAQWLGMLSNYVAENDLEGREVLLYGNQPGLSFYLQMPPAFHAWPDIDSYTVEQMAMDMHKLQGQMDRGEIAPPVVILDALIVENTEDPKLDMIFDFIENNHYTYTFFNGRHMVYEVLTEASLNGSN